MPVARPWFSGNRQRFGAIKRVICVLQFDPAALGAVPRSESNLREFLGIGVSVRLDLLSSSSRPMPPSSLRSRCRAASDTRRAERRRSPGRRGARTRHCLVDSSVSKRDTLRRVTVVDGVSADPILIASANING